MERPLQELLRDIREEQGHSLREAARALDVSPAYLSRVERGQKAPSPAIIARASSYYDVPRELLELSRGRVPEDVVGILQRHPDVLEELRAKYGSG
jgi:XRE family transcriptional regulator, stress-response regulator